MIKSKKGNVTVKGSTGEVMADLTIAIKAIYNEVLLPNMAEEDAKGLIMSAAKRGMMSEDEMIADFARETFEKVMKLVRDKKDEEGEKSDA